MLLPVNPPCGSYLYKHQLELERYLKIFRGPEKLKLTIFRCSSAALPTVKMVLRKSSIYTCPLYGSYSVPDEYHRLLNCRFVSAERQDFLPIFYFTHPNLIKYDQLMNTSNRTLLMNMCLRATKLISISLSLSFFLLGKVGQNRLKPIFPVPHAHITMLIHCGDVISGRVKP